MLNLVLDDRYRITALLGQGGMGRVYRAEQLRVGREVAVKVIRDDRPGDARLFTRFIEEARACSALQHPNVVTVHDFGQAADGTLYLVMELLQGQLLSGAIRRGEIDMGRAAAIGAQLCAGLAAAHALGLVHQDLKPSNVMLCRPEGVGDLVKILDFGVVGVADELRQSGQLRGSPSYMSPEQSRGGRVDGRADIYALGITLYEMLAGSPPFAGEVEAVLRQQREAPPPPLPDAVPEALRQLVGTCLAKLPEERPRSVGVLREALEALAETLGGEARVGGGAAELTIGDETLDEGAGEEAAATTGGTSWMGEAPGEVLPGSELTVTRVLLSLPSRSLLEAHAAASPRQLRRARRVTLEQRSGRWAVELAVKRRIRPLLSLAHPALVGWRRAWWVDDVLYLAGDAPSGEGLDAALHREGQLAPARAIGIVRALCAGIGALHALGIEHGDLRPGSIRLQSHQGFGGAAAMEPGLWALAVRGAAVLSAEATLRASRYKAPEQLAALGDAPGPPVDLYALGAVLYELLTGRPPFQEEDPGALLAAKQARRYPPLNQLAPGVPAAVDALIARLLSPSPEERPRSVEALERALAALSTAGAAPLSLTSGRFYRLDARGRIVGREAERAALREALDDARAGHGRLVLLRGPAGAGRSRLLDEAVAEAQRRGALVLRCRARASQQSEPLRVARALCADLDRALAPLGDEAQAATLAAIRAEGANHGGALRGLAPALDELFQDMPAPPPERDRITRALLALTLALARGPRWLVIAVDDLRWVDGGTLRWLERLSLLLPRLPVLVLLAARSESEGALLSHATATHLHLGPFSPEAVAALLRERLGEQAALEAAAVTLHQRSGGNPGALLALLDEGTRGGAFVRDGDRWHIVAERLSALPPADGVLTRITAALGGLPAPQREVLAAAAVWGLPFGASALRALVPGCEVVAPLEAAAAAGAIEERGDGRWRFRHEALRHAATALVSEARRGALHRAAAARLAAAADSEAAAVAAHLLRCPPEAEDVIWLRRAVLTALDADDDADAVRFARAALERGGDALSADNGLLLARALDRAGELDEAVAHYEAAAGAVPSLDQRLGVIIELSRVHLERGQLEAALRVQDGALAELGWRKPGPLRAAARAVWGLVSELLLRPRGTIDVATPDTRGRHLGSLLLLRGATLFAIDQRASIQAGLEGLRHLRRSGALGLYARGLALFGLIFTMGLGWRSGAERLLRHARLTAEGARDMESLCMARTAELNRLIVFGELDAAERAAAEMERDVHRLGKENYIVLMSLARVQASLMQGQLQDAVDITVRLGLLRSQERKASVPWTALAAAFCLAGVGEGPGLLALIDRMGTFDTVRQRQLLGARLQILRGLALLHEDDIEQALATARAIRQRGERAGRWPMATMLLQLGLRMLDSALLDHRTPTEAAALRDEVRAIQRWARRAARAYPMTRIGQRFISARLALAEGRTDRARSLLLRLVPEARTLPQATVLRANVIAFAGSLSGGVQSPEGRALLADARQSLATLHPAHYFARQLAQLCGEPAPVADRAALLEPLTAVLELTGLSGSAR